MNISSPPVPSSPQRIRIPYMKFPTSFLRCSMFNVGCSMFVFFLLCTSAFAQLRQTAILHPIRVTIWDEQQPQQKTAYEHCLGIAIEHYLYEFTGLKHTSVHIDKTTRGHHIILLNHNF